MKVPIQLLICILSGLAAALFLVGVMDLLTGRRRMLKSRLKVAIQAASEDPALSSQTGPLPGSPLGAGKKKRIALPVIPRLKGLFGKRYMDKVRVNLAKAGLPLKPEEFTTMTATLVMIGVGAGMAVRKPLLSVVFGLAAFPLQNMWVNSVKHQRSMRLERQLLDALTMLANSLRAGHSFMQALALVSRDLGPPLAPELARVLREGRMGLSVDEAFYALTDRFDSRDLELAVTGVMIQRQVGGNLAQVLSNIASTIEKRIKARGKVRALTAQGRLSAVVISGLPFGLAAFMFTFYPEFAMVMIKEPLGIAMLGFGLVSMTVGVFAIRKVVNMDV